MMMMMMMSRMTMMMSRTMMIMSRMMMMMSRMLLSLICWKHGVMNGWDDVINSMGSIIIG